MSIKGEKTASVETSGDAPAEIMGEQITIDAKGTTDRTLDAGAEMFNEAAAYTGEDLKQEEKAEEEAGPHLASNGEYCLPSL